MEPTSVSLTTNIFECKVCFVVAVNAVHCLQCTQFLCERHATEVHDCPFCHAAPFKVEIDYTLRRLVDQLPIDCRFCQQGFRKGDLNFHESYCPKRPRNCGVNGCGFQSVYKEEAFLHL